MKVIRFLAVLVCILSLSLSIVAVPKSAIALDFSGLVPHEYQVAGLFDSLFNRGESMGKKLEGQIQEQKGKLTDDPGEEIMGKTKQLEGEAMETVEELKKSLEKASSDASKNLKNLGQETEKALEEITN